MLNWKKIIQAAFTLTLVGCTTPVLNNPNNIHTLISFQGNVQVKKAKWNSFHQVDSVTILSGEDKIQLGSNASVKVYCSDLNQRTVEQPGTYLLSEVCPEGDSVRRLCPDCNNKTRRPLVSTEESLKELPYLISPRYTKVFNESLTIRWNKVSGANNYKVKVEDWEKKTRKNQIVYDGELEPGEFYSVIIVVDNDNKVASTDEDDGWYSNFIVLEGEEAKILREKVAQIKQQELSQEQEGLILAYFYQENELNFEAIQVLEKLVKSGSKTATVYQLLGDIYRQIGLSLMAKKVYQQGLALTAKEDKSGVKVMMQWGLGEVQYLLGNRDEAVEWLEKARANYLALGKQLDEKEEKLINQVLGRD
ncbi:MAG: tetratricopeptide repeat protein [Okeania sp. SIO3B5]|uniref:tetratricopeptide repeat protein n=1 Tax=Okeania sp. SIO3B5 TaxID=2607811 RepID=UPI0014006F0B|nr:tetratricopeptide repeat protein [Okeania sp. SIO3B5]NEO55846.1 tetratricopeptide repeat protein [Okeania sp. SIO3B5]